MLDFNDSHYDLDDVGDSTHGQTLMALHRARRDLRSTQCSPQARPALLRVPTSSNCRRRPHGPTAPVRAEARSDSKHRTDSSMRSSVLFLPGKIDRKMI